MIAAIVFISALTITTIIVAALKLIPKIKEHNENICKQKVYEQKALESNDIISKNIELISQNQQEKSIYVIKGDNERYL